jgi:hypothetical protein
MCCWKSRGRWNIVVGPGGSFRWQYSRVSVEPGREPQAESEPSDQEASTFRNVFGIDWACMRCGADGILQVFSAVAVGGVLYITGFRQPGFDHRQIQLLCDKCRAEWLMWQARIGYDLHTHSPSAECSAACLARRAGRRTQYQNLISVMTDSRAGFQMAKAIDGLPRVNATPLLFASRVAYFTGGSYHRQAYYESVGNPEDVSRGLLMMDRLRWIGVPFRALDSYIIAVEIFDSAYTAIRGNITDPKPGERSRGLHAVAVEQFDEITQTFRFWNNWGPGWGERGYGTMSLRYAREFYHEAFVLRHARWGPTKRKLPRLAAATDTREIRRLWSVENPRLVGPLPGPGERNSRWVRYETVSLVMDVPVTCYEIRTGYGLRMGWAFFRHIQHPTPLTEVTELYVWPPFRRMGLGTWLEATGVAEARASGSAEIHLILNEADSSLPLRGTARAFAAARGYTPRWRETVAPRAAATYFKPLTGAQYGRSGQGKHIH